LPQAVRSEIIRSMETTPHPAAQVRFDRARSDLLSLLLRGFEADGDGFAGAETAWLEALADDYLFGVGHGDAEVKDAWSGFYGRVCAARRSGR
jgi:hypothetical protein